MAKSSSPTPLFKDSAGVVQMFLCVQNESIMEVATIYWTFRQSKVGDQLFLFLQAICPVFQEYVYTCI